MMKEIDMKTKNQISLISIILAIVILLCSFSSVQAQEEPGYPITTPTPNQKSTDLPEQTITQTLEIVAIQCIDQPQEEEPLKDEEPDLPSGGEFSLRTTIFWIGLGLMVSTYFSMRAHGYREVTSIAFGFAAMIIIWIFGLLYLSLTGLI